MLLMMHIFHEKYFSFSIWQIDPIDNKQVNIFHDQKLKPKPTIDGNRWYYIY